MSDDQKKQQAEVQFRKTQRVADGKKAMTEYEAAAAAIDANTARLKALRLAREASAAVAVPAKPAPAKKGAKAKGKKADGNLADWLKAQAASGRNS